MPRTRLLPASTESGAARHFGGERFDRIEDGRRQHVTTLSALTEVPAGRLALDYRDLPSATLALTGDIRGVTQAFRRMVFNVVAYDADAHGKNRPFSFGGKQWRLTPAYDLAFSDVTTPGECLRQSAPFCCG